MSQSEETTQGEPVSPAPQFEVCMGTDPRNPACTPLPFRLNDEEAADRIAQAISEERAALADAEGVRFFVRPVGQPQEARPHRHPKRRGAAQPAE